MRRCLECSALIAAGSRCAIHAEIRRPSMSRHQLPAAVKARDGGRCVRCGGTDRVQAHHIEPISEGGAHRLGNMVTLCHDCHLAAHRGNMREIA